MQTPREALRCGEAACDVEKSEGWCESMELRLRALASSKLGFEVLVTRWMSSTPRPSMSSLTVGMFDGTPAGA